MNGLDLAGSDLTGFDIAGADLAGFDMAGADLAVAMDLSHPDLNGVDLKLPASTCGGLSVKVCEGFDGPLNLTRWTDDSSLGSVAIDSSRAFRGASSLHVHTNASATAGSEPQGLLHTTDGFPIATTIYLRAWVYMLSSNPTPFGQVLILPNAAGSAGVVYAAKDHHPLLNDFSAGPETESAAFTIPTDRWVCLRIEVSQTAATGTIKLFVGDETSESEVSDVTATGANTPAVTRMYLGLDFYGNPANIAAADMWLDEVILDDKPVTCAE
jgi:uncharacterized protein YjbI with pentapeptide repeats